jgi:hypothetical protein
MKEEYFSTKDNFVSLSGNRDLDDIAKTISINCNAYPSYHNRIMDAQPLSVDELDTLEYARFKPLEYDSKRLYYWRRDMLIPEGIRRSQDDDKEIANVQALFDAETDPDKKQILQDELDIFKWRSYILESQKPGTKENRSMRDITTDYYPSEIGMSRIWREPHSHIKDYSKSLNYGYKAYKKLEKEEFKEMQNTQNTQNKQNTQNTQKLISNVSWKPNEDKYIYSRTGLIL